MISSPTCAIDAFPGQGRRGSQASSAAPEAREHMGESADPFRLAIGVFHEPERLESAISDLFADNFVARDICLVGTRQAFDRLLPMPVAEPGRAQLAGQLQPLSPLADDPEVVATSGDLLVVAAQSRQVAGRRQCAALLAVAGIAGALVRAYRARRHRAAGQRAGSAAGSTAARASCFGIPPTPCRRTSSRRDSRATTVPQRILDLHQRGRTLPGSRLAPLMELAG